MKGRRPFKCDSCDFRITTKYINSWKEESIHIPDQAWIKGLVEKASKDNTWCGSSNKWIDR